MGAWDRTTFKNRLVCCLIALPFLWALQISQSWAVSYVYVTNENLDTVSRIRIPDGTVDQAINVGERPFGIVVTPDGRFAYVTNANDNTVSRIVIANGVVDQVINVGAFPMSVATSPDNRFVFVTNYIGGTVSRIGVTSGQVNLVINLLSTPEGVVVAPDGQHVYMTESLVNGVYKHVVDTGVWSWTFFAGLVPADLAITRDGQFLYVVEEMNNNVSRFGTANGPKDQDIPVGLRPRRIAMTPDGRFAYVTNSESDNVSKINIATGQVDQTINVGDEPIGVAVTRDGRFVYVANRSSNNISRIVVATDLVDQVINVPGLPWGVAVTPDYPDPPDENNPIPDAFPAGGPPHQIGGGGENINPPLPPGHTWTPNGQGGTPQDLTMALANLGGGAQATSGAVGKNGQIPGMLLQTTSPAGNMEGCWLPLGKTGVMPNGVEYSTRMRWNYTVRVIDLECTWPRAVIGNLTPGNHRLTYWLQTAAGLRSNCRVQNLICGQASDTASSAAPVKRTSEELTFKLQVSFFNKATGFVERIEEGMCEVEVDGETYGTFPMVAGQLTARIPFGQTSLIKFIAQEFNGYKRVRIEFRNGFMYAYDHDFRDATVEVYQCLDGESYAIEYYRDLVYICNQGDDPEGPILGRMFGR